MQVVVVPLRVNVNLKSLTVGDLVQRRKVSAGHATSVCIGLYDLHKCDIHSKLTHFMDWSVGIAHSCLILDLCMNQQILHLSMSTNLRSCCSSFFTSIFLIS